MAKKNKSIDEIFAEVLDRPIIDSREYVSVSDGSMVPTSWVDGAVKSQPNVEVANEAQMVEPSKEELSALIGAKQNAIDSVYSEATRRSAEENRAWQRMPAFAMGRGGFRNVDIDGRSDEQRNLAAAKMITTRATKTLDTYTDGDLEEDKVKGDSPNFLSQAWGGFTNQNVESVTDLFTGSEGSIRTNIIAQRAIQKRSEGKPLTESERLIMEAIELSRGSDNYVASRGGATIWDGAGGGVFDSGKYMLETAVSGGANLFSSGVKGVAKMGVKKVLSKVGTAAAMEAVRTPVRGSFAQGATERALDQYRLGANGEVVKEEVPWLELLYKSYATTWSEGFTEQLGTVFPVLNHIVRKGVAKVTPKLFGKELGGAVAGRVGSVVERVGSVVGRVKPFWGNMQRMTNLNSFGSEVSEEMINNILQPLLTGEVEQIKENFSSKNLLTMIGSVALMSGAGNIASSPTYINSEVQSGKMRKRAIGAINAIEDVELRQGVFDAIKKGRTVEQKAANLSKVNLDNMTPSDAVNIIDAFSFSVRGEMYRGVEVAQDEEAQKFEQKMAFTSRLSEYVNGDSGLYQEIRTEDGTRYALLGGSMDGAKADDALFVKDLDSGEVVQMSASEVVHYSEAISVEQYAVKMMESIEAVREAERDSAQEEREEAKEAAVEMVQDAKESGVEVVEYKTEDRVELSDGSVGEFIAYTPDGRVAMIAVEDMNAPDGVVTDEVPSEQIVGLATEATEGVVEQGATGTEVAQSEEQEVGDAEVATEVVVGEVEPSSTSMPATAEQVAEQREIPRLKDGTPDYNAMEARVFAEVFGEEFSEQEAMESLGEQLQSTQKRIARLRNSKATDLNSRAKNRREVVTLEAKAIEISEYLGEVHRAEVEVAKEEKSQNASSFEVGENIKAKYETAPKIYGAEHLIYPSGSSTPIKGRFVLTHSGAVTPSHNAEGFAQSEGFPVNEDGKTVNDRDYSADKFAQAQVLAMAASYNGRAIDSPVVVTSDGVVLSGNNRTMSGELAAKNGTDALYVEHLKQSAQRYGFTAEQVEGVESPRVLFEVAETPAYNTDTFSGFNAQDTKRQSRTERAVKVGKTMSEVGINKMARIVDGHSTLGDFYSSGSDVESVLRVLVSEGVVGEVELGELKDGDALSTVGKDLVESVLVGSVLSEDAVRVVSADGMKKYRNRLTKTVLPLLENRILGDYSIITEVNEAVEILDKARQQKTDVRGVVTQMSAFEEVNYSRGAVMIAEVLQGGKDGAVRELVESYNAPAKLAASGQQNMFAQIPSKEELVAMIDPKSAGEVKKPIESEFIDVRGKETSIIEVNEKFENYVEAKKWAVKNLVGKSFLNIDTQEKIYINRESVDKMTSGKAISKSVSRDVHTTALRYVPQIIENSILTETHPDKKGNPNVELIQRFVGAIQIDGELYRVKSTVRQMRATIDNPNKLYSYEIQEIEPIKERQSIMDGRAQSDNPTSSTNSIDVTKLIENFDNPTPQEQKGETLSDRAKSIEAESSNEVVAQSIANIEKSAEKIDDVGDKIGGAKKDIQTTISSIKEKMTDKTSLFEEIAKLPISKMLNFDYGKIREDGASNEAVSALMVIRDSVPNRPRKEYKLKRWVEDVFGRLSLSVDVLDAADVESAIAKSGDIKALYDAYMLVGGFDSGIKPFGAKLRVLDKSAGTYEKGEFVSSEGKYYLSGVGSYSEVFETKEEVRVAMLKFIEKLSASKGKKRETKFSVYQDRKNGEFFITVAAKPNVVIQNDFKSSKEAFDYVKSNYRDLVEKWENVKSVKPHFTPNRERVGKDYRGGQNVSAQVFREEFGFRGVEFGNWTTQEDRQNGINEAYDALMDLADVIGVSPRAISLGGELAIAFGARGGGKANAHYESQRVVINLTKTRGAGSLAHEWWHAIDNYFARRKGDKNGFNTERIYGKLDERERAEIKEAFKNVVKTINESSYATRSQRFASIHGSYWSSTTELSARAFAQYIENKLSAKGYINDYLANNPRSEYWENAGVINEQFPYPLEQDYEMLDNSFQALFDVMEEKADGNGNQVLFRESEGEVVQSSEMVERDVRARLAELSTEFGVEGVIINDRSELPHNLRYDRSVVNRRYGFKGLYSKSDGKVYFILPLIESADDAFATYLHEVIAHKGIDGLLGRDGAARFYETVFDAQSEELQKELLAKYGSRTIAGDELVASMAEGGVSPSVMRRIIAAVRAFFRKMGFNISAVSDNDIRYILFKSKVNLQRARNIAEVMSAVERDGALLGELQLSDARARWGGAVKGFRASQSISAEMELIKSAAMARGSFLKAPNGEPTKLSERQWLEVRTSAFKEWFGDWEKSARIEKLRKSETIKISGKEIIPSDDLKEYKRNALIYGKTLRNQYVNRDSGAKIVLGVKGVKEVLQHDYKDVEQLQSIAAIPQIIENATYIDNMPNNDRAKNPEVVSYDYYVCGLNIGGVDYTVRAVVALDDQGNRYYDHKLTQIEKGALLDAIERITNPTSQEVTPLSKNKDKKLITILQNNSSKVVDKNGEPLVVYHGTNADFTEFDTTKEAFAGVGSFFTDNKKVAQGYAGKDGVVLESFLNMRNIFDYEYEEAHREMIVDFIESNRETKESDKLRTEREFLEEHFDGMVSHLGRFFSDTYTVFNPNQIKSATGNNGEFSAHSNDIRFREAQLENEEETMSSAAQGAEKSWGVVNGRWVNRDGSTNVEGEPLKFDKATKEVVLEMAIEKSKTQMENDRKRLSKFEKAGNVVGANKGTRQMFAINFQEKMQDRFVRIDFLQRLCRAKGGVIMPWDNFYDNLYKIDSKTQAAMQKYKMEFIDPLENLLQKWGKGIGLTFDEVDEYLLAKASAERHLSGVNAVSEKANGKWTLDKVEQIVENFEYRVEKYVKQTKAVNAKKGVKEEAKYDLAELWRLVNATTEEVLNIAVRGDMMSLDDKREVLSHNWKYYVPLRDKNFEHEGEVDLRDVFYTEYRGVSGGKQKVDASKKAKGRRSKPFAALPMIQILAYQQIMKSERNKAMLSLLRLAENNKDMVDLWEVKERWLVRNLDGGWSEAVDTPPVEEIAKYRDTQRELRKRYEERKNIRKSRELSAKDKSSEIERVDAEIVTLIGGMRYSRKDKQVGGSFVGADPTKGEVVMLRGGLKYTVRLKDLDVSAAINYIEGEWQRWSSKWMGPGTRFMSRWATSKNPQFIFDNLIRDFEQASMYHFVDKNGNAVSYVNHFSHSWGALTRAQGRKAKPLSGGELRGYNVFDKKSREKLVERYGKKRVWDTLYNIFKSEGGETGYAHLLEPKQMQKKLEREFKLAVAKNSLGVAMKKTVIAVDNSLDFVASITENSTRFASFMVQLDMGKTKEEAVNYGKEITVNFNRKGQLAMGIGGLYMFLNAGFQGVKNVWSLVTNKDNKPPKEIWAQRARFLATRAVMVGVAYAHRYALNMMLDALGDDEEGKEYGVSDYVSHTNVLLPWTWFGADDDSGMYARVPVAIPLRSAWGLGSLLADYQMGKADGVEILESYVDMLVGSFSPVPTSYEYKKEELLSYIVKNLTPSILKPIFEVTLFNHNFMGTPINRDRYGNEYTPDSALAKKNASKLSRVITEGINEVFGGSEYVKAGVTSEGKSMPFLGSMDISASSLDHLVAGYTLGPGNIGKGIANLISDWLDGTTKREGVSYKDIPILKRFIGEFYEINPAWEFYEVATWVEEKNRVNKKEAAAGLESSWYSEEEREVGVGKDAQLAEKLRATKRIIRSLKKEMENYADYSEEWEMRDDKIKLLQYKYNKIYENK